MFGQFVLGPPGSGKTTYCEGMQQLFMAAPEFHATNLHTPSEVPRQTKASSNGAAQHDFKAIVLLFLHGGADSFNVLVPLDDCPTKDLYAEYRTVRGEAKLEPSDLLPINVTNGPPQPCGTFGVHKSLDVVHGLFEAGDAAFVANIGSLIEPIDRVTYYDGSKQLPPQIFA